jgi:hypothetical protein
MSATRPSDHTYANHTKSNGNATSDSVPASGTMQAEATAVTRTTAGPRRNTGVVTLL